VIGLDAMTNYYDVNLKKDRYKVLKKKNNFDGYIGSIQDQNLLDKIYNKHRPNIIIHLAAQAGVRYSINNPLSYTEANLVGTFHMLEMARKFNPDHLLIASTSSVYGNNKVTPFVENQKCDTPISFYAATKKSNEVMAHSYSHLYQIPTTVFRFFTVYGSWGRPDMALFKFTKQILLGHAIDIYNYGNMKRDFTSVYDLVEAITLLVDKKPLCPEKRNFKKNYDSISKSAPYRIVNIGNENPTNLMDFIYELENALGIKAKKNFKDMQAGDLVETSSNIKLLKNLTGFRPKISLVNGIQEFVNWYKSYYKY
jgi:UDP-glucuronate 4-epimerase